MVVKFNGNKPFKMEEHQSNKLTTKCFLCGQQAKSRIFYDGFENGNCICCNCEDQLKGMFKDYLLAESNFNKTALEELVEGLRNETITQLDSQIHKEGYKYAQEVSIVDDFYDTLTLQEVQQNNIFYSIKYQFCYDKMINYMKNKYNEDPYIVRFFETTDYYDPEGLYRRDTNAICGIAKIYNNGTTVIFGDLKVVLDRSKYNQ